MSSQKNPGRPDCPEDQPSWGNRIAGRPLPRHGTPQRYDKGCRGRQCVEAKMARRRKQKEERLERRRKLGLA